MSAKNAKNTTCGAGAGEVNAAGGAGSPAGGAQPGTDTILVLDFGGQTAQLIGRRLRDVGYYSEVVPGDSHPDEWFRPAIKGLVLSGSPFSVNDEDAPVLSPAVSDLGVPILGICYGLQRLTADAGGVVAGAESREYGRSRLTIEREHPLFSDIPNEFVSWMSHGDSIVEVGTGFSQVAASEHGLPACLSTLDDLVETPAGSAPHLTGIQFHPEVTHCEYGTDILGNFAGRMCGAEAGWSMEAFVETAAENVRRQVANKPVLLLISGGVDSTVAAALLLRALSPEQVYLLYVDTGLMRKNESEEVVATLEALGATHLHVARAARRFLTALAGVADPEEKRRIIGDTFIEVQQDEVARLNIGDAFLAQGTLYTDMIESGRGVGKKAKVIKSHHNVRSPLVAAKREAGLIVEPLALLYKDEVRRLGRVLGVSDAVVGRHPFPGPGLAVRILGAVTAERVRILQDADFLFVSELKRRGLYDKIWQAFAVLLPIRSVGVTGDARNYGDVLALRAVNSHDGMTADVYPFPTEDLLEISSLITNRVTEVGRVVYDVSSKPPSTIEWE